MITSLRALDWSLVFLWLMVDSSVVRRRRSAEAKAHDRLSYLAIGLCTALGFVLSARLARVGAGSFGGLSATVQASGIGIMLAGIALRATAISQLGVFHMPFVAIRAGHRVVDTGLYRHVRHPSYLGACIGFFGFGLGLGSWRSAVAMVGCCLVGYLYRIHVEERALLEALGEEYAAYRRRTWRLIPGVY